MEKIISDSEIGVVQIGVVQIYLPAHDLNESVKWYVSQFEYYIKSQNENFATLGHSIGPVIMLRKTSKSTPVLFMLDEREFPVISIMIPNVEELYITISSSSHTGIGDLKKFGEENKYIHFHIKDPYGNLIDIGNYPDR
jgi:catechol-2,3-dioxygenase